MSILNVIDRSNDKFVWKRKKYPKKRYLPEWITLVIMKSPLHAHDRHTLQITEHHLSLVTLDRGDRKMWDFFVWKALLVLEGFCQGTWTQLVLFS